MDAPVRISVVGCEPDEVRGHWRVRWLIANVTDEPLRLADAWVPHGKFRGQGHIALDAQVPPGSTDVVTLGVSASEAPGTVVENAFLILRVSGQSQAWRVFARMRVEFSASSMRPVVEVVTAQGL